MFKFSEVISSYSIKIPSLAGKCVNVVNTKGENINICWSPDGETIAVGNKVCCLVSRTFL